MSQTVATRATGGVAAFRIRLQTPSCSVTNRTNRLLSEQIRPANQGGPYERLRPAPKRTGVLGKARLKTHTMILHTGSERNMWSCWLLMPAAEKLPRGSTALQTQEVAGPAPSCEDTAINERKEH